MNGSAFKVKISPMGRKVVETQVQEQFWFPKAWVSKV